MARSRKDGFSSHDIAYIAVMTALLIGGQLLFSAIAGVEIVTALFGCFCYVFGRKRGMLTATAFSLLRCFVFGFYPSVLVLYLVYFNLFAFVAGSCKRAESPFIRAVAFHAVFLFLIAACVYFLICPPPITVLKRGGLRAFFIAIACCSACAIAAFHLLRFFPKREEGRKLLFFTGICCLCTVCFSLLDDAITPLFYGYSAEAAYAYFVSSFLAMLPQTVCTFVSVAVLFDPLT